MFTTLGISATVFGAIIGSFLNALIFRFNTGRSVMRGRSQCVHCGHTLGTLDLVPLFSFVLLRGRCRYCRAHISMQYPLVEIAGACISLAVYMAHPAPLAYAFWLLVWVVLLFIVVYDIRHTIIPWSASGLLGILALASLFVSFDTSPPSLLFFSAWTFAAGPVLALPLFSLSLISRGRWMGWGDSPLALALGWLLGLTGSLTAFMLAVWSGAAVGIALILLKRGYMSLGAHIPVARSGKNILHNIFFPLASLGYTMKSELPFAPFLVLGALVVHFLHVDFFQALPLLFTSW